MHVTRPLTNGISAQRENHLHSRPASRTGRTEPPRDNSARSVAVTRGSRCWNLPAQKRGEPPIFSPRREGGSCGEAQSSSCLAITSCHGPCQRRNLRSRPAHSLCRIRQRAEHRAVNERSRTAWNTSVSSGHIAPVLAIGCRIGWSHLTMTPLARDKERERERERDSPQPGSLDGARRH